MFKYWFFDSQISCLASKLIEIRTDYLRMNNLLMTMTYEWLFNLIMNILYGIYLIKSE